MTTMIDKPSRNHDTAHRLEGLEATRVRPLWGNTVHSQILIVDDDNVLLDMYSENLSDSYRIFTAQTGRVAVERVQRKSDIELAVIDYQLPDMSGIDVMKEIKDIAPSVLVIIATAYGDEDVAVEAFRGAPEIT